MLHTRVEIEKQGFGRDPAAPAFGGIGILKKMNIPCQTYISKKNKEITLFDLQIVRFCPS